MFYTVLFRGTGTLYREDNNTLSVEIDISEVRKECVRQDGQEIRVPVFY